MMAQNGVNIISELPYQDVLFSGIPVPNTDEKLVVTAHGNAVATVPQASFKQQVKYKVLKPCYKMLGSVCPDLAMGIRNFIYGTIGKLQSTKNENGRSNEKIIVESKIDTVDILVDSTQTSKTEFTTGIQRVVKKMIANFSDNVVIGRIYQHEQFITNYKMQAKFSGKEFSNSEKNISLPGVKKFILLDSSWEYKSVFEKYINVVQTNGGNVYFVIYDLIPVRHQEVVHNEMFAKIFTNWHNMVLQKTDHVMCISKAVADDVIAYYNEQGFQRVKPLGVSYFPLGADIQGVRKINLKFVRKRLQRFFDKPTFLMVGTIEPRKGHMVALEAFTKLLDAGKNINLLIIGRNGWNNDDIKDYIAHSKYNRTNILWLQDASDYELNWAYQKASCLIAASLDEGYGLPLIEGAQYGMPIICSDIPVFREVSQGYADFFKVFDADALAECVEKWLQTDEHPDSSKMKIYTWKEAADIFMEIVEGKREPYKIIS